MQHHKKCRLFLLILAAILLFSGCREDVSFILPADANNDTSLISTTNPNTTSDSSDVTTGDPAASTDPAESTEATTIPTESTTAPTEATTTSGETSEAPNGPEGSNSNGTDSGNANNAQGDNTSNSQGDNTNNSQSGNANGSENSGTAAHKHSYTQSVVSPTCTERGYTKHTCDCGDSYNNNYKDPLGHNFKETVVQPTTSSRGYTLHKCSRCDYSYKDKYTSKLPSESDPSDPTEHSHSYTKSVVAPTCTEMGYTTYTCRCGDSYNAAYKDPLGHNLKDTVVQPTTSSRGYTLHKCTRCSYSYKDSYTEKLPEETEPAPTEHSHSYTKTVVDPTCTEKGYTKYTCSCGDSYSKNYKDPLGHKYKTTVVQPTIEERGYNLHKCTRCGDSYKDNYVDKLPQHTDPPETDPPETDPPEEPKDQHEVYDISDHTIGSLEYEILDVINAHRAEAGLGALTMDKKLCALATIRAYEASISFSHTRPDGRSCFTVLTDYNYRGSLVGENLLHASPGYTASKLVNVWMKSSSHKNNILTSDFTKAGLGIYYADGRMYVANLFAG